MSGITDIELILSAVLVVALVVFAGLLWHLCGRYLVRLQVAHLGAVREIRDLTAELEETRAALERATGGAEDILDAVHRTDGQGRWTA
ncbi:hypothetical protein FZ103_00115 [Streptomonospora sp. PA3]|uniref:hypothetical protein n=1 Tax=Streptomonospora sp. PA3 TaxID=2607326 RepID=UPI0012DDD0A9|nr:hypothetical protein [Streptomonospora sp. PA3]MUL39598.1 hypothetical protein [Streptomonospora sp. PA3]